MRLPRSAGHVRAVRREWWRPSTGEPHVVCPASVLRQRFVKYFLRLSRIWSAVLCQTNGCGLSFQLPIQVLRSAVRAVTDLCAERRSILLVSSANQRSTRFIHDDEVGVKWNVNRG